MVITNNSHVVFAEFQKAVTMTLIKTLRTLDQLFVIY